jgi:anti-sigma B factor antagonist
MPMSVESTGGRSLVHVSGEMTIFQAAELKPELLMCLRQNELRDVTFDLSQVSEIDTSGLQLMLMLKREAQELGKALTFTHHSPSVLAVVDLLNLGSELGDPLLLTA